LPKGTLWAVRNLRHRELLARLHRLIEPVLVAVTVGALAAGGIAWQAGSQRVADGCWIAGTVIAVAPAVVCMLVGGSSLQRAR
jgi:hypothetical protein